MLVRAAHADLRAILGRDEDDLAADVLVGVERLASVDLVTFSSG